MNSKIIKMLAALAAVIIIFSSLSKIMRNYSLTLEEYANQNPSLAYAESGSSSVSGNSAGKDGSGQATAENSAATKPGDSSTVEASSREEAAPVETGNASGDASGAAAPSLVGAMLNGDSIKQDRITYQEGFYYEPLSDNLRRYITGVTFPADEENAEITYDDLSYVHVLHMDFEGNATEGELICNKKIAQDLVEIFYELYLNEYQLEKIHLIDEYEGDDLASMEDNNTSCFNYRVVEGSSSLSRHALGLAIDINPLYNPYITYPEKGEEKVSPASAQPYADRTVSFPYKIDETDLCYKLFKEHGFTWGGNWNSSKDYQHFQKAK